VRCNTTQAVQITLLRELFMKYGQVTVSTGAHSSDVNCYLNKSFSFLIPKDLTQFTEIQNDFQSCAAFIAGYVDAEGNFILNQNRARFKLDSYDKEVIIWMGQWLKQRGINVKMRCIGISGTGYTNQAKLKKDLWRLNVNEAASLLHFIQIIQPFAKHGNRLAQMSLSADNIRNRSNGNR
jgi:hypothetical protein